VFDHAKRRRRLSERMQEAGVAALFLAPSADLEYLTGIQRHVPFFGESSYAHGWVAGAFFWPGEDPVFIFPRMFATFDLHEDPPGELVVVNETDDGVAAFAKLARRTGSGTVAIGNRVWSEAAINLGRAVGFERLETGSHLVNHLRRVKDADELAAMGRAVATVEQAMERVTPLVQPGVTMGELAEAVEREMRRAGSRCPSFTTHVNAGVDEGALDSQLATAWQPIADGTSVMFDLGGVVDGYCSDFGRTVYCGEPPADYREIYDILLASQEAGRAACTPGTRACDVNAACRGPIEEAGLGEHFRHRMGHGIGMDVHERPFVSTEDETPLEAGMTFTDEPSIMIHGRFSVRIEDIIVCEPGGGRMLGSYPTALVASG
jgi:Xaa-Pro aminopeptidase